MKNKYSDVRIGIFGGSFNPVHKGHVRIAKYAIKHLNLTTLFFVPAAVNPAKAANKSYRYASPADRVKMLELVLPPRSDINTIELRRGGLSYSFETVRYFRAKFPRAKLFFIMGADQLADLHTWEEIDYIAKTMQIVLFRRSGSSLDSPNLKKYRCLVMRNAKYEYSSTSVRKGQFQDVDPRVRKYIANHFLFADDVLRTVAPEEIVTHAESVAKIAEVLARSLNYDLKTVEFAAKMHDLTKAWTEKEHRAFLRACHVQESAYAPFELHALTAYYWLRHEYRITDSLVLNAVKRHTTLALNLSTLDKLIFAADKLEGQLDHLEWKAIFEVLQHDFSSGFRMLVARHYQDLQAKTVISPKYARIYRKWMN